MSFNFKDEVCQFERSRTWQEEVETTEGLRGRVNEPPFTDEEHLAREVTNIDLHQPIPPRAPGQEQQPAIGEEGTPERMELMSGDTT